MPEGCVLAVSQVFPLGWACGFAVHHAFSAFSFLDYLVADFCLCWVSFAAPGLSRVAVRGRGATL